MKELGVRVSQFNPVNPIFLVPNLLLKITPFLKISQHNLFLTYESSIQIQVGYFAA